MSETVLFGKVKDPELMMLNFRGKLQCTMGGKQEISIEAYPKFWNLNPLTLEETGQRSREDISLDGSLRPDRKGAGDDSREGWFRSPSWSFPGAGE